MYAETKQKVEIKLYVAALNMQKKVTYSKIKNAPLVASYILDRRKTDVSFWNQLSYSPLLAQLIVTRRCNLDCGYCNEFDTTSEPVTLKILQERITKLRSLGAFSIEFSGGEPLLHPNLADIVRYATELKFPERMLISNAFLMTDEKIEALNDAGLTHLQVSVDGVKINDVTKKTLNPLRSRLKRISKLAKFKVVLSGVVGACPAEETIEMVKFAEDHGFTPRVLLIHGDDGQIKLSTQEMDQYSLAMRQIGTNASESLGYRKKLIQGEKAPYKCRAGSRYLYVDEFGDVHWCSQMRDSFKKPLHEYTMSDLKQQFHTEKGGCESFCTIGCARTCSALDEFREQKLLTDTQ